MMCICSKQNLLFSTKIKRFGMIANNTTFHQRPYEIEVSNWKASVKTIQTGKLTS